MQDSNLDLDGKQTELLDRFLGIGQAIQRKITKNPQEVYQLIVETICQTIGADCAVIYPYHPSFGEFYDVDNVAACGLRHKLPIEERADKKRRLSSRVHRAGEVIVEDTRQEKVKDSIKSSFVEREGIRAFMGVSLRVGDNFLGIFYVDYRKPHHFSEEEKRIIRVLGQQAAIAVSNSWSSRLADIRAAALTKLKTAGQTLVAVENLPKTLDNVLAGIAESAKDVLDADIVDLYQYIQTRNEFILPPTLVGERWHPHVPKTRIYDDDVVMRAVKARAPQYCHEAQQESSLTGKFEVPRDDAPEQRFVIREGVASSAIIPLIAANETVGVMFVNYRTPQLFSPEQKDVIESFATQAAIAIHNARLFQLEQKQRQQSDTLREVARIVNSTMERDQVIDLVLGQLGRVTEYDSASVQLIEGDRRTLVGGRGFLLGDSPESLRRNVSQDPLVSKIVQSRQPLVLSDVADEPLWDHISETVQVNSWIGVPLVVRDQVIGLLTVDHKEAGRYTQESGDIVAAFANQVALAIHNAELFSQEKHRSRVLREFSSDFEVLHAVANDLAQQPTLAQIYRTAVQAASDTLHCSHSTIFILDKKLGELAAVDRVGALEPASEVKHFKLGQGLAGIVAETGESTLVNDAAQDERFIEGKVKPRTNPRSIVLAPIKIENEVVGVISADKDETDGFTEHNLRVLEMLAVDVGVAINVHRQLQQLSNQAQVLTELNELAPQLVSIEETPQETPLLEQIAKSAQEVLRADLVELYEYLPEQNRYELPQISVGERLGPEVRKDEIHEDDAVFKLIRREKPLYVANAQEDDILSGPYSVEREDRPTERFVVREGIQSTAAIPLRTDSEALGLMFASYRQPQTFAQQQREIIELFANQAAIAIHNSRLFSESLRRRNELQVLNEIGETLTSGIRLHEDSIVQLIYEQVLKLTRTQDMYITLYDEKTEIIRFPLMLQQGKPVKFEPRRANMKKRGRTEEVILLRDLLYHRTHQEAIEWYESPGHAEFYGKIGLSFLGMPMIIGEKVLGVIALTDWEREYAYDEQDQQTLLSMASQAAIALDNANLYARRVRDIAALSEVGQTLTSGSHLEEKGLDQDQILKMIYEQIDKLIGTQDMYIALYDEETNMIQFPLMLENGEQVIFEPRRADKKHWGKTEEIIFTKQPLLHKTKEESKEWYLLPGHQEFIGRVQSSYIGVPMFLGEKVLGMIAVYDWEREKAFDEQDLHVLSSMASQAAIALDNANLFQAFSTVQKITNAIKTYEELPVLLQSVLDVALPYLNAEVGTIQLLDETSNELVLEAVVGEIDKDQYKRISLDQGITGQAAREGKTIYVADTSQSGGRFLDYLGGMRSELAIPLKSGDEIIGVFNMEDPQPNAFDGATRELAQLIADQAAIVIQNARRYARAREELIASRQLAALGTATAAIQHRINNTLNIIAPNLTRLRRRVDMSDEVIREVLDIIERNAHYTSDYIQRIQEPLKETEIHEMDINLSLREAQAKVREQYQDKAGFGTVEVKYDLADSLPLIKASLSQITEIFHNLIENSYKAIGAKGGALTIVSRRVDDWLEVEIQDNGPGIPPKILDKLFSRPAPSRQPGEGAGLGLWLSRLLLQKYAGEITMKQTGPAGTTMLVRLPVSNR